MLALEALLAIALLVVCGFAAGFFFIRHLRWRPMEKLCGSIGTSFALLYLVFGAIYYLSPAGAEIQPKFLALVSVASLALGLAVWRDVVRLFASFRVRQALAGFFFLLVWTLLILAMIRNYSGLGWGADWLEHFQRTLFFLHRFPADTPIISDYQVPSRHRRHAGPGRLNRGPSSVGAAVIDDYNFVRIYRGAAFLRAGAQSCLQWRALH